MSVSIQVWDLPLRMFHWLLALAVAVSIVTGEVGGELIDWHGRIGVLILGLLVFRIVWGFVGSTHARFADFFPTPARIAAYLKGQWQGHGHNPLGALSVIALLGALAALVGAGLFANDDIAFQGPLSGLVDKSLSDRLSGLHVLVFKVLAGLIVLHIAAIVFYARVKKRNLVVPMLTGKKSVPEDLAVPVSKAGMLRFLVAFAVSGVAVWGVISGVQYLDPVQSAPAVATPNW
ncbi:cytochrome b561 [Ferrigenium kumadai]|uniref:Cytochrome b561 n=1 Tax=Ferrigenium kumadai TaxID=1682490 RepID=A0AAN1T0J6_9PROT|nr:cytochrome b/b6 domain-containing protein [Ferrigenium kumadai]BBJ00498.1 cytochrome b561 [Ferrigenium kumadai]